jgi:hypothetical protein
MTLLWTAVFLFYRRSAGKITFYLTFLVALVTIYMEVFMKRGIFFHKLSYMRGRHDHEMSALVQLLARAFFPLRAGVTLHIKPF